MSSESQASLIGVAIACAGNVLISLALTVQKLAHKRREAQREGEPQQTENNYGSVECDHADHSEAGYLRSRLWWIGLALMGLGEAGNFLSYGFAPASVVAPLGTVALIANGVFAPLVLGESFTRRNVLGVGLAIIGAVTIVWSSRTDNRRLSPDELLAAVTALPFVVYTAINFSFIFPLTFLSNSPWGDKYIGIDVGLVALFGGYTVMATKALSSLLSRELILALEYPIAWAAIAVIVATSILQIKFLNRALMRFESKEVIPTQFVFFSLTAIIGSAVLYQEFRGVSRAEFVNFAFGVATTFLGVYFLTTPSEVVPPLSDEEAPLTPERRISLTPTAIPGMPRIPVPLLGPAGQTVHRRSSNPNLDIGLVNSPAGLYLLATTPPVTSPVQATAATNGRQRGNSGSARRSTVNKVLEGLIRR